MAKEHALTIWRNKQNPAVTQEELGEALGVSRWWINRLETGKKKPSFDLAIKLELKTKGAVTAKDFASEQVREAQ